MPPCGCAELAACKAGMPASRPASLRSGRKGLLRGRSACTTHRSDATTATPRARPTAQHRASRRRPARGLIVGALRVLEKCRIRSPRGGANALMDDTAAARREGPRRPRYATRRRGSAPRSARALLNYNEHIPDWQARRFPDRGRRIRDGRDRPAALRDVRARRRRPDARHAAPGDAEARAGAD